VTRTQNLLQLIELIYDAATAPQLWPRFLEQVSATLGGGATLITLQHPGCGARAVGMTHGLDEAAGKAYSEHFCHIDPFHAAVSRMPERVAELGDAYVPRDELLKTEIFNDWYRPNGLIPGSVAGVVGRRGGVPSVFGAYRVRGAREYSQEQLELVQALMPHLSRALQIHHRLGEHASTSAALLSALDQLAFGVILVNRQGRAVALNRAARELTRRADGVLISDGELRGGRPAETRLLQRLIHEASHTGAGEATQAGGVLSLRRAPPRRPLELMVCPIRARGFEEVLGGVTAAVFLTDPESVRPVSPEFLRELYGLTPSEAAVASLLSGGRRLAEVADELGITVNTAKVRLQEVFAKTGTHRQAELARLLVIHSARVGTGAAESTPD
jgi:DNA-binding CsgD family transcriptional regulator/PAS domain-containing protein